MLFAVTTQVHLPAQMDPSSKQELWAAERDYAHKLQQVGLVIHLWRIAGQHSALRILDVADNEHLHEMLGNSPLFPYASVEITPLIAHPNVVDTATSVDPPLATNPLKPSDARPER